MAWYDGDTVHAVTFLTVRSGLDPIEALRTFHRTTRHFRGVRWVYAGRAMVTGVVSEQLGPIEWDAVVVLQFPSLKDQRMVTASAAYQEAIAPFARHYTCAFRRPAAANAALPTVLGARGALRRLRGAEPVLPFTPARVDTDGAAEAAFSLDPLVIERNLGVDGAVIASLVKKPAATDRKASIRFVRRMAALMAETGFGPTHLGRVLESSGNLSGDHEDRFDGVALIAYPNLEFLADMARSEYFRQAVRDRKMGDLQTVLTAPILYRL